MTYESNIHVLTEYANKNHLISYVQLESLEDHNINNVLTISPITRFLIQQNLVDSNYWIFDGILFSIARLNNIVLWDQKIW